MKPHLKMLRSFITIIAAATYYQCSGQIGLTQIGQGDDNSENNIPTQSSTNDPSGGGTNNTSSTPQNTALQCIGGIQLTTPLRRLTRSEYNHVVADLLGITTNPANRFPPDEATFGFEVGTSVTAVLAQQYLETAETISGAAVLTKLGLSCDPTQGNATCVQTYIREAGQLFYRRPLSNEEIADLTTTYQAGGVGPAATQGTRLVLQALLQSPNFLYRVEVGGASTDGGITIPLTQYEIASRLSFLLWHSAPDKTLLTAAEAGALGTTEQIELQARRMLDDPRTNNAVMHFYRQWLELDKLDTLSKDPNLFPEYSPALAQAMRRETENFIQDVMSQPGGSLETLLTGNYTFVDASLAKLYGLPGVTGTQPTRVTLDPKQRAGILTHGSILATHAKSNQTSPIHRGKFIREKLLCQNLPPPPPDVMVIVPKLDSNLTTRERFAKHSTDPACSGCHKLMDPIGFGFENYDAIGRYRTSEGSLAINATGEVIGSQDVNGTFTGVAALAQRLAASDQVRQCVVTQWFRYTQGRLEGKGDGCSIQAVTREFAKSNYNLKELLVAMTVTDAFRLLKGGSMTGITAQTVSPVSTVLGSDPTGNGHPQTSTDDPNAGPLSRTLGWTGSGCQINNRVDFDAANLFMICIGIAIAFRRRLI